MDITGIILAGGKSSRLGYPKYEVILNGKNLLEIAISKLQTICQQIIVVSKDSEIATLPTVARNDAVSSVIEQSKEFHPLIGITEGLKSSSNEANIILACDMPFVRPETLAALIDCPAEICLYRYKGRAEPLLGFYKKSCLTKIEHESRGTSREARLIDILSKCNLEYIDIADECPDFLNINTEEDLIDAEKRVRSDPKLLGN